MTQTDPHSTPGSRAEADFLRRRAGAFGLVVAALLFAALVYRGAVALLAGDLGVFAYTSFQLHVAATACFLAIWLLTRGAQRSRRFTRAVEATGLVAGCTAIQVAGIFLPPSYHPEMIVTLALTQGFVARAFFVPSSAPRTFALAFVVGIPLVLSVYLSARESAPADAAARTALATAMWWLATTIICTAGTRVVYGLRREVDEAEQLGQYKLEEKLGEGAMGVVYRARHAMLARPTAVKLLLPDKLGEQAVARFEREVQQTARLTHPHTVTIYDYGRTPEGIFFYAMELLEGASLERIVAVDGPQPPERVAYVLDQVAAALSEAHGIGLIHRDIKPANIILTQQGGEPDVAKVVDFGLVKDVTGGNDPGLSQTGAIAGTPYYMAPETIMAQGGVDARSDLYALGAVGYFLLTGEPVFKGATVAAVCMHHVQTPPVPPSKRTEQEVPPDLDSLILACLAKDPAARPQTAGHLRARLWAGGTLAKWNTDRARRWWRDRGPLLKAAQETPPAEAGQTIAVARKRFRRR